MYCDYSAPNKTHMGKLSEAFPRIVLRTRTACRSRLVADSLLARSAAPLAVVSVASRRLTRLLTLRVTSCYGSRYVAGSFVMRELLGLITFHFLLRCLSNDKSEKKIFF